MKKYFLSLFAILAGMAVQAQANSNVKIVCELKDLKTGNYHNNTVASASAASVQRISDRVRGDTLEIVFTQTDIATTARSSYSILTPFDSFEETPVKPSNRVGTMRIIKSNEEVASGAATIKGTVSGVDNPQNSRGGSVVVDSEGQEFSGLSYMPAYRVLDVFVDGGHAGFVICSEE